MPVQTDETAAPPDPYCTITLSGDELRLSSADAPGDYTVLDGIDPRTLRDSDREALEDGLSLDEEALVRFLRISAANEIFAPFPKDFWTI